MIKRYYFIVTLLLCISLPAQVKNIHSVTGSIDELPSSIIKLQGIGGWINCAVDDGQGNVLVSQGSLGHSFNLTGTLQPSYSTSTLDEARYMDYDNGRVVCATWGGVIYTYLTGSENAEMQSFDYDLLGSENIERVNLVNGYLYVTEFDAQNIPTTIYIFDWTNGPNANTYIGLYHPNAMLRDFVIDGNTIYVVGRFDTIDKLVELNVSDKTNPVEAASIAIENAFSVAIDDLYIFVGCNSNTGADGLRVLFRNHPLTIHKDVIRQTDFEKMLVQGNRLIIQNGKNIKVIDITHHETGSGIDPQVIGQATFNDFSWWEIWGVVGDKLYFTDEGRFGAIDISNLDNIVLYEYFISPRWTFDQAVLGNRLVTVGDGIFSYDISDPLHPQLISHNDFDEGRNVFLYDGQCFITQRGTGIYTFKIFDIDNLGTQVGFYNSTSIFGAEFVDIAFNQNYCYAVGGQNLEIFSRTLNDPNVAEHPRTAYSVTQLDAEASSVWLDGNGHYLYVAHLNGISIYNIDNAENPVLVKSIIMPSNHVYIDSESDNLDQGGLLIACSVEGNETFLLAVNGQPNPPIVVKKQKIADGVPDVMVNGKAMTMIDGLILVIVGNKILSFAYLPGTNEFSTGAIYVDIHSFQNIKGFKIPGSLLKTSYLSKLSSTSGFLDLRFAFASQASYGMPRFQMLSGTHSYISNGQLKILSDTDENLSIGRDSQGYVTVNGNRITDESGNNIKADDVKSLQIEDNGGGANNIDLTNVNSTTFPNLPPNVVDDPTTPNDEGKNYTTVLLGSGNETVTAGDLGAHINGGGGNDTFIGGSGADDFNGEMGDDIFKFVSPGDNINGGGGDDTFVFTQLLTPSGAQMKIVSPKVLSELNNLPISLTDESGTDTLNFSQNPANRKINLDLTGVVQTIDESGLKIFLNGQFEVYLGGEGTDVVTAKSLNVPRYIDGGSNSGDTLYFDSDGLNAVDDGSKICAEGCEPLTYANFSKVIIGDVVVDVKEKSLPAEFKLFQNYPNPFNPSTVISYRLPVAGHVSLKVFDLLGREVAVLVDNFQQAGFYNYQLSTNHYQLTSGVYFYRLTAGNFSKTKKLILLK